MYQLVTKALCTLVLTAASVHAQDAEVVFRSTFDYETPPEFILDDAANLNGGIDQVGSFSGALPGGAGRFEPDLIGFVETLELDPEPMILIDRPLEDGSFFADFTSPIAVDGAKVSFDVGLRRSSGSSHAKDYDIIGLDSAGNESFHLRMSAFSGETENEDAERVGFVSDAGTTVTYDLPTVDGDDFNQDLMQAGRPPYDPGLLGFIELTLEEEGYSLFFESGFNFYTSDVLSYNGSATSISRLEFTYAGDAESNPLRSGYVLDDILVLGIPVTEILVGDCDGDGALTLADANCTPLAELDEFLGAIGSLRGDLDGDGTVQFGDFLILSASFGTSGQYTDGDLDKSGEIQFGDFLILSANFGTSAEVAASVPEPASLWLSLMGCLCLGMHRRRSSIRRGV